MNSLLEGHQPVVLFVIVFLAVLLLLWRLLLRPSSKPANSFDSSAESGRDVFATPPNNPVSTSPAVSSSEGAPEPSGIVAEVCSLRSPMREDLAKSYRGRHVRWTLSLSAISEREGEGATHIVRMYPSGRSPFSCGVYFAAGAAECAALQAAGKDDAFVVEGIIDKVEDRDIDLADVRMVMQRAA